MLRETWGTLWFYWPGSLSCPSSPEHAISMWKQVSCKQCCRGQLSSFRLYPWPGAIQAAGFQDSVWVIYRMDYGLQGKKLPVFIFLKFGVGTFCIYNLCQGFHPCPRVYIYNYDFLIPSSSVGGNRWHMSGVPLVPLPQNVVRKPDSSRIAISLQVHFWKVQKQNLWCSWHFRCVYNLPNCWPLGSELVVTKGINNPPLLSPKYEKGGCYLALAQRPAGTQSQTAAQWYIWPQKALGWQKRPK